MKLQHKTALAQLILYGELILALLVLTAAGARLYSSALLARQAHSQQRLALSYLQSQALGFTGSAIVTEQGPEGDMLVLREANGDYETRIYVFDGKLCSEFSPAGSDVTPSDSQTVCPLKTLTLEWSSPTLLQITADGIQGTLCSRGGSAK